MKYLDGKTSWFLGLERFSLPIFLVSSKVAENNDLFDRKFPQKKSFDSI